MMVYNGGIRMSDDTSIPPMVLLLLSVLPPFAYITIHALEPSPSGVADELVYRRRCHTRKMESNIFQLILSSSARILCQSLQKRPDARPPTVRLPTSFLHTHSCNDQAAVAERKGLSECPSHRSSLMKAMHACIIYKDAVVRYSKQDPPHLFSPNEQRPITTDTLSFILTACCALRSHPTNLFLLSAQPPSSESSKPFLGPTYVPFRLHVLFSQA
ncbi:hypothetical protein N657DRAFT_481188 [Parathielavia appendiculata]|uniref:Uncharacterized protein n=1 Tax=Parathielavia appendiculata TaxID=2587402 RepID=A0AAN6TXY5_9PEZI|nr:hypothetical protein N657DRAFT_481188 [Parathielavia appendiculata]